MQLFNLKMNACNLLLGSKIRPTNYRSISLPGGTSVRESQLEDLIVKNPALLNCNDSASESELLIIDRQTRTTTGKRSDLLAIDQEGYIITIEVKRDAVDERHRIENFEFQALRYAANHRTLTVEKIIKIYSRYLKSIDPDQSEEKKYEDIARANICNHLSDADNDISNISDEQLSEYIDPSRWQKIYLVASEFEADCLSACAWLREHDINIHCVKLQPFSVDNNFR